MKYIKLTQGQKTVVDDDVFDILNQYKWHASYYTNIKTFYAKRNIRISKEKQTSYLLHWYIIGKPSKGYCTDHINGDTLDNRRENLRIVTTRKNGQNRQSHRNGRLVGTTCDKRNKKWQSRIKINGKTKHLGYFQTEIEAHNRYKEELKKVV